MIRNLAFYPPSPAIPLDINSEYQIIDLNTSNNNFVPAILIKNNNSFRIMLYSHGNAEDLGTIAPFLVQLSKKLEISIFAYEYLGYGYSVINNEFQSNDQNHGYPNEEGCYESIKEAYFYIRYKLYYHYSNIILFGQSIGCGPTIELATIYPVHSIILLSPFKSTIKVVYNYYYYNPLYWMDMFTNEYKIQLLKYPIYFIHGDQDELINISHSYDLATLWKEYCEKQGWLDKYHDVMVINGAGHNDVWSKYLFETMEYMKSILKKNE